MTGRRRRRRRRRDPRHDGTTPQRPLLDTIGRGAIVDSALFFLPVVNSSGGGGGGGNGGNGGNVDALAGRRPRAGQRTHRLAGWQRRLTTRGARAGLSGGGGQAAADKQRRVSSGGSRAEATRRRRWDRAANTSTVEIVVGDNRTDRHRRGVVTGGVMIIIWYKIHNVFE